MKECDILSKAADIIEKEGWIQGELKGIDGGFCALGAINEVYLRGGLTGWAVILDTKAFFNNYLHQTGGWEDAPFSGISGWNDAIGRTKEEVVSTMRKACEA